MIINTKVSYLKIFLKNYNVNIDLQVLKELNKDEVIDRDRSMRSRYTRQPDKKKALFKTARSYKTLFPSSDKSS